MEVIETLAV